MISINLPSSRSTCLILISVVLALAGCTGNRHTSTPQELQQRASAIARQQVTLRQDIHGILLRALLADRAAGQPPRLDILALSGGGSWGAFGAGFLNGWSSLPPEHPLAMPRFDLVSGVSTGALIAPFALVGTRDSLQRVERLYRSTQESWAPMRSWLGLIGAPSLCDTGELDRILRDQMDAGLARDLVAAQEVEHRQAICTSSDVDLGRPVVWRLGDQARKGLAARPYDPDPLYKALRSSAAIPGAFEPVPVDGSLHVDGAVYGQIHVLADMRAVDRLLTLWRQQAGADAPTPTIRFWVILNNRLRVANQTVQPKWSQTALRSVELMLSAQISAPLNRLALFVEGMRLKHGIPVELRWVQIPADWTMPEGVGDFHPSVTNNLCDLGLRMGRDPTSWLGVEQLNALQTEASDVDAPPAP